MDPRSVYEDEWLVVVDKPAGMVTNKAQSVRQETVQGWFERYSGMKFSEHQDSEFGQKGGVVHRLDKDTSGLLVLAKSPEAYIRLKDQFMTRKVNKTYVALAHGQLQPGAGVISLPVVRHPKVWGKFMAGTDAARTAITEWRVVKQYVRNGIEKYALVELKPVTGRTHQLRVHLKHLGHPIVADPIYSGRRQLKADMGWCPRLFLHAARLEFRHPDIGEMMEFESELPGDLTEAVKNLT